MRESRPGVGIALWNVHTWLRTSRCPPPGNISFCLAHLYAPPARLGFRAAAVAASGRNTLQQRGRIGKQRKGAGKHTNPESEHPAGMPLMWECSQAGHAPFCVTFEEKPIARCAWEFRYPGSPSTKNLFSINHSKKTMDLHRQRCHGRARRSYRHASNRRIGLKKSEPVKNAKRRKPRSLLSPSMPMLPGVETTSVLRGILQRLSASRQ